MATATLVCWSCRKPTVLADRPSRGDVCPHCRTDLRSCKNCAFYDTGAHNQCRETISEYVPDKERGNFCGMWQAFGGERAAAADVQSAKAKLEALFKKT